MATRRYSNIIGFDDAPFTPDQVGPVPVVGVVFTGLKLTGVVIGEVEKDGSDAAEKLAQLVAGSKFAEHVQLVMLQGITLAGFNVVDVLSLHQRLGLPVQGGHERPGNALAFVVVIKLFDAVVLMGRDVIHPDHCP